MLISLDWAEIGRTRLTWSPRFHAAESSVIFERSAFKPTPSALVAVMASFASPCKLQACCESRNLLRKEEEEYPHGMFHLPHMSTDASAAYAAHYNRVSDK